MKNNLMVIDERVVLGKEFRIYGDFENPLFMAKDVAEWIEYDISNVSKMLKSVDEDEKTTRTIITSGNYNTEAWFLTEEGLYEVLMLNKKPIAKQFRKQVKEILKSVRKHGAYMTENTLEQAIEKPDFMIGLLNTLKQEKEARLQVEKELVELKDILEVQAPKVQKYNEFLEAEGTMSVESFTKALAIRGNGKIIGRNKMFQLFRLLGILTEKSIPTQQYMNKGYFIVRHKILDNGEIAEVTRITPLGVDYLMDFLLYKLGKNNK